MCLAKAAGVSGVCDLPAVSFVDPNFGFLGTAFENSEEAPTDMSNPPASLQPGGGAECHDNILGGATSLEDAIELCPALAAHPTGPYPRWCANFDQYGVRVPFMAISPFSKPHYVSHRVADHTSILAFIERAFLPDRQHLTRRDKYAYDLRDPRL